MKKVKTEQEKQDVLQTYVDEYYKDAVMRIRPVYPYILVRLLPRAHKVGSLFVPETSKKIMHEGIVLETFRPFWQRLRSQALEEKELLIQPPAEVGAHILFEWFEGVPVEHTLFKTAYVQSQKYVLVAASPVGGGRNGVLAVVENSTDIEKALEQLLADDLELDNAPTNNELAKSILENFLVTPKDQTSVTRSGVLA